MHQRHPRPLLIALRSHTVPSGPWDDGRRNSGPGDDGRRNSGPGDDGRRNSGPRDDGRRNSGPGDLAVSSSQAAKQRMGSQHLFKASPVPFFYLLAGPR